MGIGVPKDFEEAAKWYRMAADQGFAKAQYNLGVCYCKGVGVPKDDIMAYMWFNLAASNGFENAARNREITGHGMTPAQIAETQKLSREWQPKNVGAPP